jgi:hypothetical protein
MSVRQALSSQVTPGGQALPHPPQLAGSVAVSVHLSTQRVSPGGHSQSPWVQICPAKHVSPQRLQFAGSVVRFVQ